MSNSIDFPNDAQVESEKLLKEVGEDVVYSRFDAARKKIAILENRTLDAGVQNREKHLVALMMMSEGQFQITSTIAGDLIADASNPATMALGHHLLSLLKISTTQDKEEAFREEVGTLLLSALENTQKEADKVIIALTYDSFLSDNGDAAHAIDVMQSVLQSVSTTVAGYSWVLARLGEHYLLDYSDTLRAITFLVQATEMLDCQTMTHGWVHRRLAQALNQTGKYDEALIHAKKAVELFRLDPFPQKHVEIGGNYEAAKAYGYGLGSFSEMDQALARVMELVGPDSEWEAECALLRADIYINHYDYPRAHQWYQTGLRLDPERANDLKICWQAGISSFHVREDKTAIQWFQHALTLPSATGSTLESALHYYAGAALLRHGKIDQALEMLNSGYGLDTVYDHKIGEILALIAKKTTK